jgi:transcription antitermination protein NusB
MKHRRQARELALQVLYACEMYAENEPEELIRHLAREHALPPAAVTYGRELATATLEHRDEIDGILRRCAANWELKRMAALDRNILRMATAELLFYLDVPYRVVIDEAVELAKSYGSDESGKFVNGVLDAVYRERFASSR